MRFDRHSYKAFSESGEYSRQANIIDELPTPKLRLAAIAKAKQVLGMNVKYGEVIGLTNHLTRDQIRSDPSGLLALRGCDLPLSIMQVRQVENLAQHVVGMNESRTELLGKAIQDKGAD